MCFYLLQVTLTVFFNIYMGSTYILFYTLSIRRIHLIFNVGWFSLIFCSHFQHFTHVMLISPSSVTFNNKGYFLLVLRQQYNVLTRTDLLLLQLLLTLFIICFGLYFILNNLLYGESLIVTIRN